MQERHGSVITAEVSSRVLGRRVGVNTFALLFLHRRKII